LSKINGYLTQTNKGWTVGYRDAVGSEDGYGDNQVKQNNRNYIQF
jgi:hypothetical protein